MAKHKVEIVGIDTANLKAMPSEETLKNLKNYKETRQSDLLDIMVKGNLKLVLSIVNKYAKRSDNLDDLFQIGTIGLLKAIENFDLSQDVKFSTYAVPMIEGEIRRYLRDSSFLRVSRQIKDLAYHYMKEKEKYVNEYGKIPEADEIAKKLNASSYDLQEAVESTLPIASLNEPLYNDFEESIHLGDIIPEQVDNHQKLVTLLSLKDGINSLTPLEKEIIQKRYYEGISQVELAKEYGISQAQVSRLEKNALIYLRKYVI